MRALFSRIGAVGGGGNRGYGRATGRGTFMLMASDDESLSYRLSDWAMAIVPRLRAFFSTAGRAGGPAGTPRPYPHSKSLGGWRWPPLMRFQRHADVTEETKKRMQRQMLRPQMALISKHVALSGSTHSK